MNNSKISIRFYNDHEVRAVWVEENARWYFSVLDVIGAINGQDDYAKTRNYWKYLKTKLKKECNELVSATNQLKLLAPDGKRRLTDTRLFILQRTIGRTMKHQTNSVCTADTIVNKDCMRQPNIHRLCKHVCKITSQIHNNKENEV